MFEDLLDIFQVDKLADICINIGTLFFAATVLPFFIGIDKPPKLLLLSGIMVSVSLWAIAITIVKQKIK